MEQFKFYRGVRSKYNITTYPNDMYFATDTHEIIVAGTSYGIAATDLSKLNGIAAGAQVNILESVSLDGTALTITNKGVNIPLASRLTDYTYSKSEIDTKLATIDLTLYLTKTEAASTYLLKSQVYNGLDSDSTTSALAAVQGKLLSGLVGGLGATVNNLNLTVTRIDGAASVTDSFRKGDADTLIAAKAYADSIVATGIVWNDVP